MKRLLYILISCILLISSYFPALTYAVTDPTITSNNKFGIHIISATEEEISPAADLVNSNGGDWGYITVIIESKDRNKDKWQTFFNSLRRRHLIPIVRIATHPEGNYEQSSSSSSYWKRPYEGEEIAWADFLDNLNWPVKNRYITIYNEPNHAAEWGGTVDAKNYAQVLNKTITALKTKNPDFFVLNAGLDASAPQKLPNYQDQLSFMQQMNEEVPGIFNKLDGWVSHSYPNPAFAGKPEDTGRGTIRTWQWEIEQLKQFGVEKNLPIFITETGWRHSEGKKVIPSLPSPEIVGKYYAKAFQEVWNNPQIVAVTPFLLNYQDEPFDHFSFKRINGKPQEKKLFDNSRVLALQYPEYYPHYLAIQSLNKIKGSPQKDFKTAITDGEIYKSIVADENYVIPITFKNTGQSIWNDGDQIKLVFGENSLNLKGQVLPPDKKIEPGENYTFNIAFRAPSSGKYKISFNLYSDSKPFNNESFVYETEVKEPVSLEVKAKLKWKENSGGDNFILNIVGAINRSIGITLNPNGSSETLKETFILPDLTYDFTLSKPFYKSKTIRQKVVSGTNILEFGELQPDISSAIFNLPELWKILPFSN